MEIALGALLGILLGLVSAACFVQFYRAEHVIALARDGRLWRVSLVDFRSGRAPEEIERLRIKNNLYLVNADPDDTVVALTSRGRAFPVPIAGDAEDRFSTLKKGEYFIGLLRVYLDSRRSISLTTTQGETEDVDVSRVADLAPSGSSVAKPDTGAEFVGASYGSASANVGSPLVFATRWFVLPLGSAAMFIVSWLVFDDFAGMLLGGFFGSVFLALTLTDLDRRLLPNRIIYPSIILAMALSWAWPNSDVAEIMAGGLAGVAVAVVLLLVSLPFGANALGLGDIKMIILIGFVVGLPSVLIAIFIGTLAAGVIAGFLLITRIRGRRDYIPHGPFLAIGALSAMWFGDELWDAYRTN